MPILEETQKVPWGRRLSFGSETSTQFTTPQHTALAQIIQAKSTIWQWDQWACDTISHTLLSILLRNSPSDQYGHVEPALAALSTTWVHWSTRKHVSPKRWPRCFPGCWFVRCWGLWIRLCESGRHFWKLCFALQIQYQYSEWPQNSPLVCLVLIQPRPWARQMAGGRLVEDFYRIFRCSEENDGKHA